MCEGTRTRQPAASGLAKCGGRVLAPARCEFADPLRKPRSGTGRLCPALPGSDADWPVPPGGSILSTRCSETYETKTALISLFGIPLWYFSQSPRVVIQVSAGPAGGHDAHPAPGRRGGARVCTLQRLPRHTLAAGFPAWGASRACGMLQARPGSRGPGAACVLAPTSAQQLLTALSLLQHCVISFTGLFI